MVKTQAESAKKSSKTLENKPKTSEIRPKSHPNNSDPKTKKIKKVHLPKTEIESKMKQIQDQISELQGGEHHKKRKRLYYKMAKLKKAFENPELYLIDETKEKVKADIDLQRRITKKKSKNSFQVNLNPSNKKKSCLICKRLGHTLHECPESGFLQQDGIDHNLIICYNCGRIDHTLKDCRKKRKASLPFAVCYVCKESGHIARDCPKNEKGLYARGGGCYICDSVRHKASECPNNPTNMLKRNRGNKKIVEKKENNGELEEEQEESMEGNGNNEELEPDFEDPE